MITLTYVTVTYNAANVLQRTLDSVLAQVYGPIEHIIIDGGSTDGTLQLVDSYIARSNAAGNGHSIQVTSEPDHGIYDAMNKGLRSATGDYVCFLNAGDTLPSPETATLISERVDSRCEDSGKRREERGERREDSFEAAVVSSCEDSGKRREERGERREDSFEADAVARERNLAPREKIKESGVRVDSNLPLPSVLYGDTDITDADGRYLHHRRLSPPEHLTWRSFRHGMLVCHQAFYARTDFAVATPFDTRYRYSADVDWCIRIMRQADREHIPMLNLHAVVANYMEQGATTRNHRQSLKERFHIMRRHYGLLTTLAMHVWFVFRLISNKK